ncbi:MAG: non-canonical purine NTP pyrophosphatase [Candidatus Krumholzibacteria bacterium]|nr:non-canonical purine NTP pyrophosphatase [Candidatus Krumholzibacteria bacterium]MDH4337832.1 non-canonical purine NTP pyrophosphatase [Candidatus Krumholzibacteria bacterium]MDH5270093.1 non-canonical purine NTP pyrophosphatase [Candidatus Krumholzibacteria bacterium]
MEIVLATRNKDKVREIVALFAGLDIEVSTLDDFPEAPATVEDGETLEANAIKKASEARDLTGHSALADDTGLEVESLGGAPGIFAARYAGEEATYQDNCRKLLREMRDVPPGERQARFRTVMALALAPADTARLLVHFARHPDLGKPGTIDCLLSEGVLPGEIAAAARGESGFGYDPVFIELASGRTLAEMTEEEKNATSHRYRAAIGMRELLLRYEMAHEGEKA